MSQNMPAKSGRGRRTDLRHAKRKQIVLFVFMNQRLRKTEEKRVPAATGHTVATLSIAKSLN